MKSPTQVISVAIVQMLLFVFLLPIIVIIFLLSFLNKKIDWRKFATPDFIKNIGKPRPYTPKKSQTKSEDTTTYDVTFAAKAR